MDYIIVALFLMLVIVVIPFVFKQLFVQEKIKDEPKIVLAQYRAEILTIFGSYFGRNDDLINSF